MSWPLRIIRWSYVILFTLVPLIVLPWTSELFEFNKIVLTWALTTIIICAWVTRCITEKRLLFTRTILDLPLILFLSINLLSLLYSIDIRTSFLGYYGRWNGGLLSWLSYSLLYWAFVSNLDSKFAKQLINWLLVTAGVVSVYAIAQHFGIDDQLWIQDVKTRVFSTLGQPNWLAAFIVAIIFIPLSQLAAGPKPRPLTALLAGLLFVTLLFTKSRSGLLAFGLSIIIFWIKLGVEPLKKPIVIGFWLFLAALSLSLPNPVRDLIIKSKSSGLPVEALAQAGPALETGGTESGTIRKIVWKGALRIWQSSPKTFWLGTGPETFAMSYYQHRPIEHNNTSEWELLYNKAHNEFLNILATTGLLGLISYSLLLLAMAILLFRSPHAALATGWASLPVTNFWGFSVTPVQLLLFLFPALASAADHHPQSASPAAAGQKIAVLLTLLAGVFCLFQLGKYWLADFHYSASQKALRAFSATNEPSYLVTAYQSASQAYYFNPSEPVILTQLAESAAYLSIITSDVAEPTGSSSSAQLTDLAQSAASSAITYSPAHPSHYKAASRVFILLSALDPKYLDLADSVLETATSLSPTDPRLPYNRGLIAKYQSYPDKAKEFLNLALRLKPDFADATHQLQEIASSSGKITP